MSEERAEGQSHEGWLEWLSELYESAKWWLKVLFWAMVLLILLGLAVAVYLLLKLLHVANELLL